MAFFWGFFWFQMTAFTEQTLSLLSHQVFVNQLQAMQEFFHACRNASSAHGKCIAKPSLSGVEQGVKAECPHHVIT